MPYKRVCASSFKPMIVVFYPFYYLKISHVLCFININAAGFVPSRLKEIKRKNALPLMLSNNSLGLAIVLVCKSNETNCDTHPEFPFLRMPYVRGVYRHLNAILVFYPFQCFKKNRMFFVLLTSMRTVCTVKLIQMFFTCRWLVQMISNPKWVYLWRYPLPQNTQHWHLAFTLCYTSPSRFHN